MLKLLFVTGEDYSSMNIEQHIGIKKAAKMTEDNGGELIIKGDFNAMLVVREFEKVDPYFISFIKDRIQGKSNTKHTNFFVLEGGGFTTYKGESI